MGEIIEFAINGESANGYFAEPVQGVGPVVIVIQEYWGIVDHIKDVCDRFAANGFFALAPDLYRGDVATEPNEAAKYMMALDMSYVSKLLSSAANEAMKRTGVTKVGVVGFCMGGGLALVFASECPNVVGAVAPFYGLVPWPNVEPNFKAMTSAVQGHYAELDEFAPPNASRQLERKLHELGKDVEFFVYPGTHHAFFNDTRPEVYDAQASNQAWDRLLPFFKEHLGA